jgi:hypothetical protein
MKILVIGDIHGKEIWKQAVDKFSSDVIVFIGDYVNGKRWIGDSHATLNLKALLDFRKQNDDRVKLLIGNHDLWFLNQPSLLRRAFFPRMNKVYKDNEHLFDIAYGFKQNLFSHAGVSEQWYHKHRQIIEEIGRDHLAEKLNQLFQTSNRGILFERGKARDGSDPFGGPVYADKSETENSFLKGYAQFVGHTKVPKPLCYNSDSGSITFIDCLNSQNAFVMIDDAEISVATLDGKLSPMAAHSF